MRSKKTIAQSEGLANDVTQVVGARESEADNMVMYGLNAVRAAGKGLICRLPNGPEATPSRGAVLASC